MAQAIPFALMAASAGISAAGSIVGSKAESKALKAEADQLDAQAGRERATSQRAAMEQRRQSRLLASRAIAVGAATGGALDPTVLNIISRLEGEGEYRALSALYEGEEEAIGLENQAAARRREAKNVKKGGLLKAAGTIIGAGSDIVTRAGTMKAKYG